MSVARQIAWRFMLKGTSAGKFSPLTLFAWLAIGVGVGAMSSLLSVMYGFESALKERVLKAYPHIMVRPRGETNTAGAPIRDYAPYTEKFRKAPGVARVMPFAETEMIVQSDYRTLGAVIWGMPKPDLARIKDGMVKGTLPDPNSKLPQVVMGVELARRMGSEPGKTLKIISPIEKTGPMGSLPASRTFEVSGIYSSGHYEFDQQYVFMLIEDEQDLLKWGDGISGWHIWADTLEDTNYALKHLVPLLPAALQAQSWEVFNSALFGSLKLEQYAMFTIFSFAILIAVMNIVITLIMHVNHKRRNIGILRAIGASARQIRQIFMWQGALLGAVGLCLGAFITVAFIIYVRHFSTYELPDIYYDRSIPIEVRPLSLVLIYAVAVTLIFLGTLYPSKKAAKLDPIEAIRE